MSFLHNPSQNILNILYKGEEFPPINSDLIKQVNINIFSDIKKAATIAEIIFFHQHIITFLEENKEVEKIKFSSDSYLSLKWKEIIDFEFCSEVILSNKQKSIIKKKWDFICKEYFPYKKTKDNYKLAFGFLSDMPDEINMINKYKKKELYSLYRVLYYFELTRNNIDTYLKILLGDNHYKYYYLHNERLLLQDNNIDICSRISIQKNNQKRL